MVTNDIAITIDGVELAGTLAFPEHAVGLVVFAHGSGSSRFSPRNQQVAQFLQNRGLATLLCDLLTAEEGQLEAIETTLKLDVDTLAERLIAVTDRLVATGATRGLPLGYFGGSTGAAAALIAASRRPTLVTAVVSRGGRVELARPALASVRAPTLLLVGSEDATVLAANRDAADLLAAPHRLDVIPGAAHLFEEPGALDQVASLAAGWFLEQFATEKLRARAG